MNYTSTGQGIVGVNSKLEGILQHDQTYYATITCENGAGLISTYQDTKGRLIKIKLSFTSRILLDYFGKGSTVYPIFRDDLIFAMFAISFKSQILNM